MAGLGRDDVWRKRRKRSLSLSIPSIFHPMFSDHRTPRGFKPRAPNFFPWLRGGLKPQRGSDPGLNGQCRSRTALERAKELIQGKERDKKADVRPNGVVTASRGLLMVSGGRHILPERPANQRVPVAVPVGSGSAGTQAGDLSQCPGDSSATSARLDCHNDGMGTPLGKYGPVLAAAAAHPTAAERSGTFPGRGPSVQVLADEGRGRTWSYAGNSSKHRDPSLCGWFGGDKLQGSRSGFTYAKEQTRDFQSQRDLTRPEQTPVEGVCRQGSLCRLIFSTEVPARVPGCPALLQGPGKPRLSSEALSVRGQNLNWVHPGPLGNGGGSQRSRKHTGRAGMRCSRKAVRDQIDRVVVNLEQVVGALRDIHQEMKEVVEQIDNLTSSIDLNAEEQEEEEEEAGENKRGTDSALPLSDSSSTSATLRRSHVPLGTASPPPLALLSAQNAASSPGKVPAPRVSNISGSPAGRCRPPPCLNSPARSALLVSPSSPGPLLHPSVTIETSRGEHPSASPLSPSTDRPPPSTHRHTHRDTGLLFGEERPLLGCVALAPRGCPARTGASKPPVVQGRRGQKPPPYPHNRLPERTKKVKEPRDAPPYPEKRRLLSTTV